MELGICNKNQASALGAIILGVAKQIIGCTCYERGNLDLSSKG